MLIAYPYNPETQDLWLYEPVSISWTSPTPDSFTAYRPYAWNPNSPLYGYRRSLSGMSARLRTFSTPNYDSQYFQYNDPNLSQNNPVYRNSWPMPFYVVNERFMYMCAHCFGVTPSSNRSATQTFVPNYYGANTLFDSLLSQTLRWIDGDNNVIQSLSPTQVLSPYVADNPTWPNISQGSDNAILESTVDLLAPPVTYADPRTLPYGGTAFAIDSNAKIIRVRCEQNYILRGRFAHNLTYVNPDGSESPLQPAVFLHDSGTNWLVEIKPPTSAEAGDGILGIFPSAISSSCWENGSALGAFANNNPLPTILFRDYIAARGYSVPPLQQAFNGTAPATATVDQQILSLLEQIPTENP